MSRTTADFKSAKKSKLSRDEMISKLGQPDADLSDLHVACYHVNSITKRDMLMFLLVIPVYEEYDETGKFDLALIQFDQTDHISGYKLVQQGNGESYEHAAKKWLGLVDTPPEKHR